LIGRIGINAGRSGPKPVRQALQLGPVITLGSEHVDLGTRTEDDQFFEFDAVIPQLLSECVQRARS
jgi:hypothetical protein